MIIPALMVFVSCGGKKKNCHLEFEFVFFLEAWVSSQGIVEHIVTISGPLGTSHSDFRLRRTALGRTSFCQDMIEQ